MKVIRVLFFLLPIIMFSGELSLGEEQQVKKMSEVIGSSHVIPRYYFGKEDCLNEGADALLEMGSQVIKIWFYNGHETPDVMYPHNSKWVKSGSLVEGLENPHYAELFDKPFTTFVLNVSSFVDQEDPFYWFHGVSEAQAQQEEAEFYEFTKALLKKYEGTGKTFIFQHHEGDWHTRDGITDPNLEPAPKVFASMTDWLNARQRGVSRARKEMGAKEVFVYHAAEVNLVAKSLLEGKPNIVNRVLPFTNLDLVSYSCYDTCLKPAEGGDIELLRDSVRYIKKMMPDSEVFGNDNVYLGEYGIPENEYSAEQIEAVMRGTVRVGLEERCPYIIYWQLYCNEFKKSGSPMPAKSNDEMRGFWLIRPDGTKSWHYNFLKEMCHR